MIGVLILLGIFGFYFSIYYIGHRGDISINWRQLKKPVLIVLAYIGCCELFRQLGWTDANFAELFIKYWGVLVLYYAYKALWQRTIESLGTALVLIMFGSMGIQSVLFAITDVFAVSSRTVSGVYWGIHLVLVISAFVFRKNARTARVNRTR